MGKASVPAEITQPNMIVAGTIIKGDVESNGDIRFDGTLTGNIKTKGKLIIGSTGVIKGEIDCKNSDIEGRVDGKITVSELLTLKSTSIIEGDIIAKRLAIDPGAKFTGTCSMSGNDVAPVTKTFDAKK